MHMIIFANCMQILCDVQIGLIRLPKFANVLVLDFVRLFMTEFEDAKYMFLNIDVSVVRSCSENRTFRSTCI